MAKVERTAGRMYYVDGSGKVMSAARKGGDKRHEGVTVQREAGWFYFVDGSGEVKRSKRKGAKA